MQVLLISHFARNIGTTDHVLDFLDSQNVKYTYLRHPLPGASPYETQSYLGNPTKIAPRVRHSATRFLPISILKQSLLTAKAVFDFRGNTIIAFGSINSLAALLPAKLSGKRNVVFWGVDYSRKRFSNRLFNAMYRLSETISCKFATLVVQPTNRQEQARITYHGLAKENSLVVPNGIAHVNPLPQVRTRPVALVYSGSITDQHGIIALVKILKSLDESHRPRLFIFGSGDQEKTLKAVLRHGNADEGIVYYGQMAPSQIHKTLSYLPYSFVGIAPYAESESDHIKYGDSLKIKDYLSWGMPFMASDLVYIESDLRPFGETYSNEQQLIRSLGHLNLLIAKSDDRLLTSIRAYEWSRLLKNIIAETTK